MKWQILLKMPGYSIETQKMIVAATMTLHNYVRAHDREDVHFARCDMDPNYVPTILEQYKRYVVLWVHPIPIGEPSGREMNEIRDQLHTSIALG